MRLLPLLIVFVSVLPDVRAAEVTQDFRLTGKVEAGTGDGSIVSGDSQGSFLAFDLSSENGKKILRACKVDDQCEVTGTAKKVDEVFFLRTIKSVRRLPQISADRKVPSP